MGFKTLIFLIILIVMTLFFVQNLESISLLFLGFKSVNFPLSLWIIMSLFAGILSSLIIQFLSNNPTQKISSNESFSSNKNISDNDYPSPTYNPPSTPSSFTNKKPLEKTVYSPPPMAEKNIDGNNIDDDINFDSNIKNINEDQQNLKENKTLNINTNTNNIEINSTLETESIFDDNEESEEVTSTTIKSREASVYSSKPREKTQTKPSSSVSKPNEENPSSPPKKVNNSQSGIYDAPYRVINPIHNDNDKQKKVNNNFDDENEDWDF